jgi:hypothetical protein
MTTRRKKSGRPANPYKSQALFGEAGWSNHYFDHLYGNDDRDLANAPPHAPLGTSVETLIAGLLLQAGPPGRMNLPLTRTVIEATLNVDHYIEPQAVTNALKRLCRRTARSPLLQVFQTRLPIAGQKKPSDVYSIGRLPSESELATLRELIQQRARDFDPRVKGKCAEHYIWSLLRQSGRFGLHHKAECGEVRDASGKNKLDILATEKTTGKQLGISVKNERQWFHPGSRAIKDVYKKASAYDARPMLVAPHITEEAKQRCERDGIITFELRRQLLPAELTDRRHTRVIVERLRAILGPQRFEHIPKQFPRPAVRSADVLRDIAFIGSLEV